MKNHFDSLLKSALVVALLQLAIMVAAVLILPLTGCMLSASSGLDYGGKPVSGTPSCVPDLGQTVSQQSKNCGASGGMETGSTLVLKGVNFLTGTASLTTDARLTLDSVVDTLKASPAVKVEIGGHTDSKGTPEANDSLSESRAKSVMAYLAGKGVEADRMTAKGYGSSAPLADNDTAEGRELNRRVELKVVDGGALASTAKSKSISYVDLEPSMGGKSLAPTTTPAAPHPVVTPPKSEPAAPPPMTEAPKPAPVAAPPPPVAEAPVRKASAASVGAGKVTISNYEFSPETITVSAGAAVTWTNQDSAAHTIKFPGEETGKIATGATYSRTFSTPGEVTYQCGIHPYMTGKVIVK